MVALFVPPLFFAPEPVTQTDSRTTAATSHSNVDFGPQWAGSWVVVLAWHGNTSTNPGFNPTCTIGGISAARFVARTNGDGAGTATGATIFAAQPTSGSGTVSVSWGGLSTTIIVLRVVGYDLSSAFHTAESGTGGASVSINIPSNGLLLGAVGRTDSATAVTWTNLTEKGNEAAASNRRSWGWDSAMAQQTGRSVSYSPFSSALGQNVIVVASFSPS